MISFNQIIRLFSADAKHTLLYLCSPLWRVNVLAAVMLIVSVCVCLMVCLWAINVGLVTASCRGQPSNEPHISLSFKDRNKPSPQISAPHYFSDSLSRLSLAFYFHALHTVRHYSNYEESFALVTMHRQPFCIIFENLLLHDKTTNMCGRLNHEFFFSFSSLFQSKHRCHSGLELLSTLLDIFMVYFRFEPNLKLPA